MSLLTRSLLAASLSLTALPALAVTQDDSRPVGPTMGDVVRQAEQPARPVATQPVLKSNAPTMGDLVKQQDSQAHAAQQAAQAAAPGCTRPKAPGKVPDGKTATQDEMRQAQTVVKTYVTESEAFNVCLDRLVKSAQGQIKVSEYLALIKQYDLTIGAMQVYAERFNEQLRVFKARTAAKP